MSTAWELLKIADSMSTMAKKPKKAWVEAHHVLVCNKWTGIGTLMPVGTQIQDPRNIYQCNEVNLDFTFSRVLLRQPNCIQSSREVSFNLKASA